MHDSVKHPSSKDTWEVLFILFWAFAREDSYELTTSIVFLDCFIQNIPKLKHTRLSNTLIKSSKFIIVVFYNFFQNQVQLWINVVTWHHDVVCSSWRDLNLARERSVLFIAFVFATSRWTSARHSRISFWPIFNFVEWLLFTIESLDLDHIKSVTKQTALNCVIKRTIRT